MSEPVTQTQAELDREEALYLRAVARRLLDMAMDLAEDAYLNAKASAEPVPAPAEPGSPKPKPGTPKTGQKADFERASRTARRCMLLARKLAEPLPPPRPPPRLAPRSTPDQAENPPFDRVAARKRVIREVEDAIDLKRRTDKIDVELLEAELHERLDRSDFEIDLRTRPIELVIADLARDVGCGKPLDEKRRVWKRRTPEDIDILNARAAKPPPNPIDRQAGPAKLVGPDKPLGIVLEREPIRDG